MTEHLATAIDATKARLAALGEAKAQLERRTTAIRAMHYDDGMPKAEVARVLYSALRDEGLTADELVDAGVTHASVEKILRTAK